MTKEEFLDSLKNKGVSTDIIHFENSVAEGYYVIKNYHRWEVSFRERGKDYDCLDFPSESDALEYLYEVLLKRLMK